MCGIEFFVGSLLLLGVQGDSCMYAVDVNPPNQIHCLKVQELKSITAIQFAPCTEKPADQPPRQKNPASSKQPASLTHL